MYRLFSLSALLFLFVSAEPRTPKIYNVLISTKKNLSPSHALPIYEPVLRTTSLGIALPPIFYHSFGGYQSAPSPDSFISPDRTVDSLPKAQNPSQANENASDNQGLRPLPIERFIPYYSTQILNDQPYYTSVNQQGNPQPGPNPNPEIFEKPDDPKSIIANLKRNPDIPDVPPPALPVRNS